MISFLPLAGGAFLGWSLGGNDAPNVFGTAVASRIISFRKAALLCSAAIIAGAFLQGQAGLATLGDFVTSQNMTGLTIASITAAMTVTAMTLFRLPVSASQAIVGAISGISLATGTMEWALLLKVVICWLATPIGAMVIACVVYKLLGFGISLFPMSILTRDKILWSGLLIFGVYGSYALGANNVANATGIFANGRIDGVTDQHLVLLGGITMALGVITFSKRVMFTVGSGIMPLDAFTSLVAVAAMSFTLHIFAMIGVPVSTSQGIVGAIMGIGLMRGTQAMRFKTLGRIGIGWVLTPLVALILSAASWAIVTPIVTPAS